MYSNDSKKVTSPFPIASSKIGIPNQMNLAPIFKIPLSKSRDTMKSQKKEINSSTIQAMSSDSASINFSTGYNSKVFDRQYSTANVWATKSVKKGRGCASGSGSRGQELMDMDFEIPSDLPSKPEEDIYDEDSLTMSAKYLDELEEKGLNMLK